MTQHASLTPERWRGYSRDQQLLMIGNEMNRCKKLFAPEDRTRLGNGLERVLRLTDLTVQVNRGFALRRELLRFRGVVADLYLSQPPSESAFRDAFRVFLQLVPATYAQIPHILS